jgi:hypothetical protein
MTEPLVMIGRVLNERLVNLRVGIRCREPGVVLATQIEKSSSLRAEKPSGAVGVAGGYSLVGGGAKSAWENDGLLLTSSFPLNGTT